MTWTDTAWRRSCRIVDGWTDFWFAPQDALSLGVLRVLVGEMMLYTHIVWGLNLEGFFGPDGWQSLEAIRGFFAEEWLPSLWWYVPVDQLRLVHVLCMVPLLMFALGLFTPATSVLALVITVSNSNRAPLANYGLDQILAVLGLYLVIGGSGDRFSLDAWRKRRRIARREGLEAAAQWTPPATSRARLGMRLIQVHFCVIYFFSGISKLQGDAWWNGEAVWMAFANKEYQSIDMTWLARYPWITQLATHATILWEISFPFVIWNRTLRPFMLLMGVGMHAGIALCMGMVTFGSIMIFGYLGFIPPEQTQRAIDAIKRRLTRTTSGESAPGLPTAPPQEPSFVEAVPVRKLTPVAESQEIPLAFCDPEGNHLEFAHYLTRRGYQLFLSDSPVRLWQHVEQYDLHGAILFVDRLNRLEFKLLLDDLTLFPVADLPILIASQREQCRQSADALQLNRLRTVALPAPYRDLRHAIEHVLPSVDPCDEPGDETERSRPQPDEASANAEWHIAT